MTPEQKLKRSQKLGYKDAVCLDCYNLSVPTSEICKECLSKTTAFTEAVNNFLSSREAEGKRDNP